MYFGECGGRLLRIQTQHNATDFKVLEMMDGEDSFRWAVKYVVDLAPLTLPKRKSCKFMVLSVMKVGPNENMTSRWYYAFGAKSYSIISSAIH